MNDHIQEYYREFSTSFPQGKFDRVISLDEVDFPWKEIESLFPEFPRGWYELMEQSSEDRIEFCREYWLQSLPYHKKLVKSVTNFFAKLDTILVFITQSEKNGPLTYEMVYSKKEDEGFYRGRAPLKAVEEKRLMEVFREDIPPEDYVDFLKIHNGFCKATDTTGILHSLKLPEMIEEFRLLVKKRGDLKTLDHTIVDPQSLYPFYQSFNLPCYHCFWKEWYPKQEMGVVYYSGEGHTISGKAEGAKEIEKLSFPTFSDWLSFYLEEI
jgi:hypothetical protein